MVVTGELTLSEPWKHWLTGLWIPDPSNPSIHLKWSILMLIQSVKCLQSRQLGTLMVSSQQRFQLPSLYRLLELWVPAITLLLSLLEEEEGEGVTGAGGGLHTEVPTLTRVTRWWCQVTCP